MLVTCAKRGGGRQEHAGERGGEHGAQPHGQRRAHVQELARRRADRDRAKTANHARCVPVK